MLGLHLADAEEERGMEQPVSTWFPGAWSSPSTAASVLKSARRTECDPESCKEYLILDAAEKSFQRCNKKKKKTHKKLLIQATHLKKRIYFQLLGLKHT